MLWPAGVSCRTAVAASRSQRRSCAALAPGGCLSSWHALLQDGTQKSQKVYVNIPTEVGATEAEEIGEPLPVRPRLGRAPCRQQERSSGCRAGHAAALSTSCHILARLA